MQSTPSDLALCYPVAGCSFIDNAMKIVKEMQADKHDRSFSWMHCHQAFGNRATLTVEELALHLAFYLASWGMYRGSSFLLQKAFTIHLPIVRVLLETEFEPLWDITVQDMNERSLSLTVRLADKMRLAYLVSSPQDVGGPTSDQRASDTLVSKVLLGTVCCTPAFDTSVRAALRSRRMVQQFSERGMREIYCFCKSHSEELAQLERQITTMGYSLPPMRLIDMALWVEGDRLLK